MQTDLIKEYGSHSPMYIFDKDILRDRAEKIRKLMPDNGEICYAVKANPFLVGSLKGMVRKYEVCSPGELDICMAGCIQGEDIVFSGVNKEEGDMERALRCGVRIFTVESEKQMADVCRCAERNKESVCVLLRLTSGTQFGVDETVLERMLDNGNGCRYVEITGIQYFSGTQKKARKIEEELQYLIAYYKKLKEKYSCCLTIEYGPGLPVPYFEGENFETELETGMGVLTDVMTSAGRDIQWVIEMGRFLAASCGYYVTKVVDIKENHQKHYCIVDGGINHVNYYGQNMAMRVPLIDHIHMDGEGEPGEKEWTICGSLCTTSDVLVRKTVKKGLKIGDLLVFKNIGAYSVTEGIYLFLSRKMPEIYLYSAGEGMKLVREALETSGFNRISCPGNSK